VPRQQDTSPSISELDAKLLMNHSIPDVNAGYVPANNKR
jgi:hypothetical protein